MNTNVVELCRIDSLSWRVYTAKEQEDLIQVAEQWTEKGYLCTLMPLQTSPLTGTDLLSPHSQPQQKLDVSTPAAYTELWVFILNEKDVIPIEKKSKLTKANEGVWRPVEFSEYHDQVNPKEEYLKALPIFRHVLEGIAKRLLLLNRFDIKRNRFIPPAEGDRHFYQPACGLNSDVANGSQPTLSVSLDYFIDGGSLCVHVIVQRMQHCLSQDTYRNLHSDPDLFLPSDAVKWVQGAFLGLEDKVADGARGFTSVWSDEDSKILCDLFLPIEQGQRWMISGSPSFSSHRNKSTTAHHLSNADSDKQFARKRPRQIENDERSEDTAKATEVLHTPRTAALIDAFVKDKGENRKDLINALTQADEQHDEKIPTNPIFAVLARQVALGLKVVNPNANRHLHERLICPPQYQTGHQVCDAHGKKDATMENMIKRFKKERNYTDDYSAKAINSGPVMKPTPCSSTGKIAEVGSFTKSEDRDKDTPRALPGTADVSKLHPPMDELTALEMQWAALLLEQDALVPWRHSTDSWLAIGGTDLAETASVVERLVTLKHVFPVLLMLRDWLNRSSSTESRKSTGFLNSPSSRKKRVADAPTIQPQWMPLSKWGCSNKYQDESSKPTPNSNRSSRRKPLPRTCSQSLSKEMVFDAPSFVVSYMDQSLQIQPKSILSWEAAQLRPYVEVKNVEYMVLCPGTENEWLAELTKQCISNISSIYQDAGLGQHAPTTIGDTVAGAVESKCLKVIEKEAMVIIPKGVDVNTVEDNAKPFQKACQELKPLLENGPKAKTVFAEPPAAIIVYVVSPYASTDKLNRNRLLAALSSGVWGEADLTKPPPAGVAKGNIVFELLFIDQLVRAKSSAPMFREICFSVFNKILVDKQLEPRPTGSSAFGRNAGNKSAGGSLPPKQKAFIYEPLYVLHEKKEAPGPPSGGLLPSPRSNSPGGGRRRSSSSASISSQTTKEAAHQTIHGCFVWTEDKRWLVKSWTDLAGNVLQVESVHIESHNPINYKELFKQMWITANGLMHLIGEANGEVVITKVGEFSSAEVDAWDTLLKEQVPSQLHVRHSDSKILNFSIFSLTGSNTVQLIPSRDSTDKQTIQSYGCISKSIRYELYNSHSTAQLPSQAHVTRCPAGYLFMNPNSPNGSCPPSLGGAVADDLLIEHAAEVTLEITFELQYSLEMRKGSPGGSSSKDFNAKWERRSRGQWIEQLLGKVLKQFHDLSWLTFHPATLQRHSPLAVHLAAADSLSISLNSSSSTQSRLISDPSS